MNKVVGNRRPLHADRLGADVMRHASGARRKNRQITAAILLHLQLWLDASHQNVVVDREVRRRRLARGIGEPRELLVAELMERLRLGRVMTVDVDDHLALTASRNSSRRSDALASVWSSTETSQYSDRGRHS